MKKDLAFCFLFLSLFSFSQALITSNDMPTSNKYIVESQKENYREKHAEKSFTLQEDTKSIENFSSAKIIVSGFPSVKPSLNYNAAPEGWVDLGVNAIINSKNLSNVNLINVEGFTKTNDIATKASYQFAIGVFIDNKLKMVQNFWADTQTDPCAFSAFGLSGILENLSIGKHEVKLYACNLSNTSPEITSVAYGGYFLDECSQKSENLKIHLTIQYSE